ncbi:hypothetical protein AVEN_162034-1, partial [Araneus ventricosus]
MPLVICCLEKCSVSHSKKTRLITIKLTKLAQRQYPLTLTGIVEMRIFILEPIPLRERKCETDMSYFG